LQDDILDVFGDSHKVGKQQGGDIISNKKTYLLLKAMELATGETLRQLQHWTSVEDFDAAEKVAAVTAIYAQLNIRQLAEERMMHFHTLSLGASERCAGQCGMETDLAQLYRKPHATRALTHARHLARFAISC
jgi:geranylgeranyl diphosphate synthase type II